MKDLNGIHVFTSSGEQKGNYCREDGLKLRCLAIEQKWGEVVTTIESPDCVEIFYVRPFFSKGDVSDRIPIEPTR